MPGKKERKIRMPAPKKQSPLEGAENAAVEPEVEVSAKEIDRLTQELAGYKAKERKEKSEEDRIEFANGAVYEKVGACSLCSVPVYNCTSNQPGGTGASFDQGMKGRLAVYVPGAWIPPVKNPDGSQGQKYIEPPTFYCQRHDPTNSVKFTGKKRNPDGSIDQRDWEMMR